MTLPTQPKPPHTRKKKSQVSIKKPPVLFKETQKIIKKIQEKLEGDFLSYWISANGMLSPEDVIAFYDIIKKAKKGSTLYLFIKSDGGSGKGALRITHLFRNYFSKVVSLVPLDCASAATMLALGSDTIQMGPIAYLSAIDTSITHDLSPLDEKFNELVSVSQNELDRVLRLWELRKEASDSNPYGTLYPYIHPLVFGSVDRASSLSIKLTREILSYHMEDEEKAEQISNHLNAEYPSHSYPITFNEAKRIGLNVQKMDDDLNDKLLELNELYSKMAFGGHTDFDESNYHDNEIVKIIEMDGLQYFYQTDKDWHYRTDERRYISMNDESSWKKARMVDKKVEITKFHIG